MFDRTLGALPTGIPPPQKTAQGIGMYPYLGVAVRVVHQLGGGDGSIRLVDQAIIGDPARPARPGSIRQVAKTMGQEPLDVPAHRRFPAIQVSRDRGDVLPSIGQPPGYLQPFSALRLQFPLESVPPQFLPLSGTQVNVNRWQGPPCHDSTTHLHQTAWSPTNEIVVFLAKKFLVMSAKARPARLCEHSWSRRTF